MLEQEVEKHRQDIGRKCVIWRNKMGISQTEAAKKTGHSRFIIYNIELGKTSYTIDSLRKYASYLGRTIEITQVDEL